MPCQERQDANCIPVAADGIIRPYYVGNMPWQAKVVGLAPRQRRAPKLWQNLAEATFGLRICTRGQPAWEPTEEGNQSCPEAPIPDLAVRIIRLFEELNLGFSESNLTLVPFLVVKGCVLGCNIRKRRT